MTAFKRVFRICDRDGDGRLSDSELNGFQMLCFNQSLSAEEIQGVKTVC